MMFVIGIVLFALAILVSVALHECGHMWVARATGMKVRRYFVGFGPTLWSTSGRTSSATPSTASRPSRSAASATSPA